MTITRTEWLAIGAEHGWGLPERSSWCARLPFVRHVRALWGTVQVARHGAFWGNLGLVDSGYDGWVLAGMWRGWV